MKIEDLQSFRVLCTCKSFSAAAEKLFMSRYALMRVISSLENELGANLFLRSPNGIQITALGEQILLHAENLLSEYEQMLKLPEKMKQDAICLTIGCYAKNSTSYTLAKCVETFNEGNMVYRARFVEYPQENFLDLVLNGTVDMAFTIAPPEDGRFSFLPIIDLRMEALVKKDSPFARAGQITHAELFGSRLVMPMMTGGTLRVLQSCLGSAIRENVMLQSNDMGYLYQMIADGDAVGIFNRRDAGIGTILFGNLTPVDILPEVSAKLGIVYKKCSKLPDSARAFLEHVQKNYNDWFCG